MNKKLQEKILAEIRNKAIERDFQKKDEYELKQMREANIEALTELTSLSRDEIDEISREVKKQHEMGEKIRKRRITQYIVFGAIAFVVAFFVFKPKHQLKARIVEDNFKDNTFEWSILNSFKYNRYIKDKQYFFETNVADWCYWDEVNVDIPTNCDIELASKWMNGKYDTYGLGLQQSDSAYYAFSISGDGEAKFGKVINKTWVINDSWHQEFANKGKMKGNLQKVELRNKNFKYYVNDKLVKAGTIDLNLKGVALRCCGEQKVAFEQVRVTNTDNKKVIFEDNFANPSSSWTPKKNFTGESKFENGKYVIDVNTDNKCHWSTSALHKITNNCEIELTSTWQTGELADYGIMIMNDDDNYYSCESQNNGNARLVECKYNKYTFVQNYVKTAFESDGKKQITQKVVIKDDNMTYFLNNQLIKKYPCKLLDFPCKLGIRSCGKQTITCDKLKITYYE